MCDTASPEGVDWCGDEGISVRLEDGRGSERGGINRLVGSYELDGERLRFGPLATTLMPACPSGWRPSASSSPRSNALRPGRSTPARATIPAAY